MQQKSEPLLEERVIRFHRSLLAEGPALLALILFVYAAFYFTGSSPYFIQEIHLGPSIVLPIPLLGLPALLLLFYIIHRRFNFLFIINHDHVCAVHGILSVSLQDVRIEYENIRGVEIDRSLYQRIFNLGDIKVGSAMRADVEVWMPGVRSPDLYRSIIEARMREHIHRYRPAPIVGVGLQDTVRLQDIVQLQDKVQQLSSHEVPRKELSGSRLRRQIRRRARRQGMH